MTELACTPRSAHPWRIVGVLAGLVACAALFLLLDQAFFGFANARFPRVGESTLLATLWGLISRVHVLVPAIVISLWRPQFVGLHVGRITSRWRMLAAMLLVSCGVVAAFILVTGATPYGGNQWLFTEVVTVPVIEELVWRGIVLSTVLHLLTRAGARGASVHLAVWSTGAVFGALHLTNALAGVPLSFAVPQAVSAIAWGIMYGYARTSTDSVYPPMALHAGLNLVVVWLG